MSDATIQELQARLELLERSKEVQGELNEMQSAMVKTSFLQLQNIVEQNDARDRSIEILEKQKLADAANFTAQQEANLQRLQQEDCE